MFGASHQIMHIMVVCAALAYTKAILIAFDYHQKHYILAG
jgi:adiponectin receptor